jgi:uncharacterized membrane protein SpoIIM required for sporulation
MNLDRFVSERSPLWAELDALLREGGRRPERLGPDRVRRLATLYRAAAADLATARRAFPGDPAVAPLERLVPLAYAAVYGAHRREGGFRSWVSRRFWQLVLEDRPALLLAAVLLLTPAVATFVLGIVNPAAAANLLPAGFSVVGQSRAHGASLGLPPAASTALAAQIFTNNIQVAFLALAGGLTGGVLTALSLLYNGVMVGAVAGLAAQGGQGGVAVQLLVPHGMLELSCIVVSASCGFRLARAIVDPGRARRRDALAAIAPRAAETALGVAAYLVLAGIVEGFVTPSGIGAGPALAVGCTLAALFWVPVVWRGRGAAEGSDGWGVASPRRRSAAPSLTAAPGA